MASASLPSGFWFEKHSNRWTQPHTPVSTLRLAQELLGVGSRRSDAANLSGAQHSSDGVFLFLWNFNPFSSTVLYYYSTEALHFSEQFVGSLTSWQAVGLVTGSIMYGAVCRTMPMRLLIHGSIVAGVVATIAYWGYQDATSGVVISLMVGVVYAMGSLIQLDLAARVCRVETAGTTFALLMSLTNLSTALSQGLGGTIYEAMAERWGYAMAFHILVAVGALFTAACWLLMPILGQVSLSRSEVERAA